MLRSLFPRLTILLALIALPGASAPTVAPIETLRRAAEVYRSAGAFLMEGDIQAGMRAGERQQSTSATFRIAVGSAGRIHDHIDHPQVGVKRISDGKQTWVFSIPRNQYTVKNEVPDPAQAATAPGVLGPLLITLKNLADDIDTVTALPDQSVQYQGLDRPCAVIEVRYKPSVGAAAFGGAPRTFWIDRERHWVLKSRVVVQRASGNGQISEQSETFRYTHFAIGEPDAKLFAFTPPTGAKRVEEFTNAQRGESLAGQTAIEFSLADLAGKKHSLKAQRGKVVMLDFWASWCGPCRVQMPLVDKLSQEYKGKGLVVYAVNQGESAETARKYLEKNKYTTTALLDQKNDVGRQYKVSGIPTLVIIDREGKIAAHYVGVRSESVLREGLKKAGL